MIGHEPPASPFSGKRRRPLFRRLFYREEPFDVLEPTQLRAIFEAFSCVARLHPVVLHWVHQLDEHEWLVSSFHHRSMLMYAALEVVHVTPDDIGYYRLPGAKIGGRGRVAPGLYPIVIGAPGGNRHHLRLRKCRHGQLHLDEVCAPTERDASSFQALERHVLERSKFADEMRTIVERGLEWSYQRALLGEPEQLSAADKVELTCKCAGISPKADAFLAYINRRNEARGDES